MAGAVVLHDALFPVPGDIVAKIYTKIFIDLDNYNKLFTV